ncbi:hypothetical protein [Bradyrhizobium sp. AZCC 2289]|uniref:hypothetical protein n=1 Tax=Bradyrhizobium sp. AZCC 2289 TaxID=3117026 RepID=UPI002FF32C64
MKPVEDGLIAQRDAFDDFAPGAAPLRVDFADLLHQAADDVVVDTRALQLRFD